ncbi:MULTISPECIES: DUF1488 domain-containing protein [Vibrio]|jgi:hypothetical protein|uniref:DUF1488 domain-containing protein n=1 Tax=Vibrio TaxID=662 RepID=UPI00028D6689|nr:MULTISPECIES: DUF1488 domain-containing protein [Vibrio]AWA99017.1 DUF1488 domain-containing protein [Vibrio harveyi]EKM11479.1 hypothetical protein VCHENC01_2848 [Vibrio harveyi]EKO3786216.1 DUF1488 domain-containing protein [Vibrio harveyi]EKO3801622.1 DUF1488 domain-containing protein [Vibrio harveyi]EKO3807518.1 DUF1488 domain-containing protein [Vibrio harveyi]
MNQSILFPDMQSWDKTLQAVNFTAQQSGALIECYVTKQKLEKLSGSLVETEQAAIKVFIDYRFDLEEIAEELIEDEAFNEEGNIIID